jgi:hypothetical protein
MIGKMHEVSTWRLRSGILTLMLVLSSFGGLARARTIMTHIGFGLTPVKASLRLSSAQEAAKPVAAELRGSGDGSVRLAALESSEDTTIASPVAIPSRKDPSDKFAIYTNTLLGDSPKMIFSDPRREVNHARVSPDHQWVVFTRYNKSNWSGVALETNGYLNTEIIRCRIDGSECATLLPPRSKIVSANAYWTPDGKNILFVSNETPDGTPGIKILNVASNRITPFYEPSDLFVADPHMVGTTVVMPGKSKADPNLSHLYLVNSETKSRRMLTDPKFPNFRKMQPPLGDHDPKLSPDGKEVATMRHVDKDEWHVVVIDVATGVDHDLSAPGAVDGVPEWSSDSRLLIFWSVVRSNMKQTGLYVMRPDGTQRMRVPLPYGFFYTMPAFVPGTGSGPGAGIIYTARIAPNLR